MCLSIAGESAGAGPLYGYAGRALASVPPGGVEWGAPAPGQGADEVPYAAQRPGRAGLSQIQKGKDCQYI